MSKTRCSWSNSSKIYKDYHDNEWGVPIHNSLELFELLMLELNQAGLSWIIVLKKRDDYRLLFDQFDPIKMSQYSNDKVNELMLDSRIIRHKLKINAMITNAKQYLELQKRIDFSKYLWAFVDNKIVKTGDLKRSISEESILMSKALRKEGFKFLGPTTCYAFMQAAGMVNDHSKDCFKYNE